MERHDTILLTCAEPENRRHLRYVLDEHYNLLEADNLRQCLLLLEQNQDCIAAVMLASSSIDDPARPLLPFLSSGRTDSQLPVIVITEKEDDDSLQAYFRSGASDVIPLRYDSDAMLLRIDTIIQLYLHKQHLESVVQKQADLLRRSNDTMVDMLSSIIEYRSMESGHHILRIRYFTKLLMDEVIRHCPEYQLTDRLAAIIASASALHDIGKIAIPDAILMKPGPLTAEEWEVMKTHTTTGCQILDTLQNTADREYLRYAHNICHYHHERWDGSGYPEGLTGDQIPICAQVVGLADAYEALTSKRVYKDPCTFEEAVNRILQGDCGSFSPQLLECFKNVTESFRALTQEYADGRAPEDAPFDMSSPPPVVRPEGNSLERLRGKYYALVHYVCCLLIEVSLDQGLFHVVYNPYPELAQLEGLSTLSQLTSLMLDQIIVPEERERMQRLIYQGIPTFVEEDLRRSTHRFHYRTQNGDYGGPFEMTLLRIGAVRRRSLAILFRKLPQETTRSPSLTPRQIQPECTYVCRNNQYFTLVELGSVSTLAGYTAQDIQEQFQGHLSELIHPEDQDFVRKTFQTQLQSGNTVRLEHRVTAKDGRTIWVSNQSRLIAGEDGQEVLHCFLNDISQTRLAYEALKEKHRLYRSILTDTRNVLFDWDLVSDTISYSDTGKHVFHFPPPATQVYQWLTMGAHMHPDEVPLMLDRIHSLESGSDQESLEARILTAGGHYRWCRFRAHANRDSEGRLTHITGSIIDIDAEKQTERILQDRAERDPLTKLLNKAAGRKRIEAYLSYYPSGVSCAMVIIDLDSFKQINDRYGHLFGDSVLVKVAQEIKGQFTGQDIVCRIGGDEFLVLARGLSDQQLLEQRCQRLITALRGCLRGQYQNLNLSCSIGIALCPNHGTSYYELFEHADQALYQAKIQGKNGFCFYEPRNKGLLFSLSEMTAVSDQIDSDEVPGLAEDNIVRHAFQLIYGSDDIEAAFQNVFHMLGTQMNVSRVYVFENSEDGRTCSNTFEWCNHGITPQIQNLQNVEYSSVLPNYQDNFDEKGVFYCPDISVLPRATYDVVAPQGIKSMLQCAIRQNGQFRGYIGFDECVEQRLWTKEEIQALTYFSEVLATFLLKHREQKQMRSQAEDLRTILENQNAWIYIIDPDTREVLYLNEKARRQIPGAKVGLPCYQSLMGRKSLCPDCPALAIREKKTACTILQDEKHPLKILAEATMIHWHGKDACLMTCRKLPQ